MRILFLIAVIVLLFMVVRTLLRRPRNGTRRDGQRPPTPGNRNMVRCDYCGLHVPENEALLTDGRRYCSREHQRLDQLPHQDS